jgi:hypothetical protein
MSKARLSTMTTGSRKSLIQRSQVATNEQTAVPRRNVVPPKVAGLFLSQA